MSVCIARSGVEHPAAKGCRFESQEVHILGLRIFVGGVSDLIPKGCMFDSRASNVLELGCRTVANICFKLKWCKLIEKLN